MKNSIRTEVYKALHNKMFFVALAIGGIFVGLDAFSNTLSLQEFHVRLDSLLAAGIDISSNPAAYSLFSVWMPAGFSRVSYIFYMIWPILVALPYGWSYNQERRTGIYNQIAARTSAKTYYSAKYIAVFISGGLVMALTLLLDLLVNAMVVPYVLPEINSGYAYVLNRCFLSPLFYSNPWLYALLWSGVQFLFGGAAACLCFLVGTWLRHPVMVMLVPYVLYLLIDSAITSLRTVIQADMFQTLTFSPLRIVQLMIGGNPEWLIATELLVLIGLSYSIGYWQVVKHELA